MLRRSDVTVELEWDACPLGPLDAPVSAFHVAWRRANDPPSALGGVVEVSSDVGGSEPPRTVVVQGLEHSTAYVFTVAGGNDGGVGPASAASEPVETLGAPTAVPTGVACADATAASVRVSWSAAQVGDGEAAILSYVVRVKAAAATADGRPADALLGEAVATDGATSVTVAGLPGNQRVYAVVHGANTVGVGAASDRSPATWTLGPPSVRMAAPVCSRPTTASVDVSWAAAARGDHDAPITVYEVRWRLADAAASSPPVGRRTIGGTSTTVDGLASGTAFVFCVVPHNDVGQGPESEPSLPVQTLGVPTRAPSAPVCRAMGIDSVEVSWPGYDLAPTDAPLQFMDVLQRREDSGAAWSQAARVPVSAANGWAGRAAISGLPPATSFVFALVPVNPIGAGAKSPASPVVRTHGPPAAPTAAPTATLSGHDAATVAWVGCGAAEGAGPAEGYQVAWKVAGTGGPYSWFHRVSGAGVREATVTGLAPATSYEFAVCGVNRAGIGAYSPASAPVRTAGVPGAVATPPTASDVSQTSARVSWAAPPVAAGSLPLLSYTVAWRDVEAETGFPHQVSCTAPDAVITGLQPGRSYVFRVAACNAAGVGPWSAASSPVATAPGVAGPVGGGPVGGGRPARVNTTAGQPQHQPQQPHYAAAPRVGASPTAVVASPHASPTSSPHSTVSYHSRNASAGPAGSRAMGPCRSCGATVEVGLKFCTSCGVPNPLPAAPIAGPGAAAATAAAAPAPVAVTCTACSAPVAAGVKFCTRCGAVAPGYGSGGGGGGGAASAGAGQRSAVAAAAPAAGPVATPYGSAPRGRRGSTNPGLAAGASASDYGGGRGAAPPAAAVATGAAPAVPVKKKKKKKKDKSKDGGGGMCTKCLAPLRANSRFCTTCGTPVSGDAGGKPLKRKGSRRASITSRNCTSCHKPLIAGHKFCTRCGATNDV